MKTLFIHRPPVGCTHAKHERGITLIVSMIILLIISVIASMTIKTSMSSEIVANNSRSQQMAWQAAEAALRYYEVGVTNTYKRNITPTLTVTYVATVSPHVASSNPMWTSPTLWDAGATAVKVPLHKLDDPSSSSATSSSSNTAKFQDIYKRSPECMAQYRGTLAVPFSSSPPGARIIEVVCRGFGPEVADITGAPNGSEVFLQSTLDFN